LVESEALDSNCQSFEDKAAVSVAHVAECECRDGLSACSATVSPFVPSPMATDLSREPELDCVDDAALAEAVRAETTNVSG
jgi:hypothetical protein